MAEIGRCAAPCAGHQTVEEYQPYVLSLQELVAGHRIDALWRVAGRLTQLSDAERFEQAAEARDRLATLVRTLDRGQRLASLAAITELIAARPDGTGGWDFAVVRHGRLASAGCAPRGVAPMPVVEMLASSAETVIPSDGPLFGAPHEETSAVLRWLERPGTRMVRCTSPWTVPAAAAASWRPWLDRVESARALVGGIPD